MNVHKMKRIELIALWRKFDAALVERTAELVERTAELKAARTENEQLRALLAQAIFDHQAEVRVLSSKLFQAHAARSKAEAQATQH